MYNNSYQTQNMYAQAQEKNLTLVKGYFKKKSVLVLGILFLLSTISSVVFTFLSSDTYARIMNALMREADIGNTIDSTFLDLLNSSGVVFTIATSIISAVISGLFIASFFIIYFKSRNPAPTATPKAGFTILYVFAIISLVFVCLYSLLILLLLAMFSVVFSMHPTNYAVSTVAIIIPFVFLGIFIGLFLFYSINTVRFLGSVRYTLSHPDIKLKGAKAFGICNIVLGVFLSILSLFIIIMLAGIMFNFLPTYSSPYFQFNGQADTNIALYILAAVLLVMTCVIYILYGTISLGYDKHIRTNMPRYAAPAPGRYGNTFYQSRPANPGTQASPYGNYGQRPANPYTPPQPANSYTPPRPANSYTPPRPANPYIPPVAPPVVPAQEPVNAEETAAPSTTATDFAQDNTVQTQADTAVKECPSCHAKAAAEDLFCQHCGEKLS